MWYSLKYKHIGRMSYFVSSHTHTLNTQANICKIFIYTPEKNLQPPKVKVRARDTKQRLPDIVV